MCVPYARSAAGVNVASASEICIGLPSRVASNVPSPLGPGSTENETAGRRSVVGADGVIASAAGAWASTLTLTGVVVLSPAASATTTSSVWDPSPSAAGLVPSVPE